jgi:regulatory protein
MRRMALARRPDDEGAAKNRALKLLERRPQSVAEINRKLKLRGYTAEAIRGAVNRLKASGLLDDEKFARDMAAFRLAARPQGRRALVARLLYHGVKREMAEAIVAETMEGKDEAELAGEAARKYAVRFRGKPIDEKARRRLEGHLARRGFGWNSISKALRRLGMEVAGED